MKRFYEYISCISALYFSGLSILLYVIIKEINIIIIFNFIAAIISWGIFICRYRKNKYLQRNAKFVWGKIVKGSVKFFPFMKDLIIIEVLVTYYEPETKKTLLFKGRCTMSIIRYRNINKMVDDIFVLVGYNPLNVKQYIVYLKNALEKTLINDM